MSDDNKRGGAFHAKCALRHMGQASLADPKKFRDITMHLLPMVYPTHTPLERLGLLRVLLQTDNDNMHSKLDAVHASMDILHRRLAAADLNKNTDGQWDIMVPTLAASLEHTRFLHAQI